MTSQLGQDRFVLQHLNQKRGGYFVEFGACDGVTLSNTHLLEREFGWTGVLAEPARCWWDDLCENRTCAVDNRCVWSKSGELLMFNQTPVAEYSTIHAFTLADNHGALRIDGDRYGVLSVSLTDLLVQHDAPPVINYLSLDTEGSELDILAAFDFDQFDVRALTVEHNYTPNREAIRQLLTGKGFRRTHESVSAWDDWYVKR